MMTPEEKHNFLLDSVNLNHADKVLGGEIYQLTYLFTWKRTPHGDLYWRNFRNEKLPLSKNAIAYIEMIIEEKTEIQSKKDSPW